MTALDLPDRASALALITLGYPGITPRVHRHSGTGASTLTWSLHGDSARAHALLHAASTRDPAAHLATLHPEHPYLCAIYYQQIHHALLQWLATGTVPLTLRAGAHSRLLRLLPDSPALRTSALAPHLWPPTARPTAAIADPAHAAVAILCGFVPAPHLDTSGPHPRFLFHSTSLTFPDLTLATLQAATLATVLPPYPPGEHPACYALAAAANLPQLLAAEKYAATNPTHLYKGHGTRSALLSDTLLRPDAPPKYRDALRRHLAAT